MLTYELGKNKYYSLYSHIREDILNGRIKAGEKLPSKRSLAQNLGVSVITVQTAYDQLLAEGYIFSRERSGYFVADVNVDFYGNKAVESPIVLGQRSYAVDFVKGSAPAELFPFSYWAKLMRNVLSDCGEHLLERVPCDGDGELKAAIAGYLYRVRGITVDPRYIIIGAGAEQLYGVIVQLLGRDKVYAVENPGYKNIAEAYRLNGAEVVCANVFSDGVNPAEWDNWGADILHISPSHHFPTGAVTPASSRTALIARAAERGGYIVEDDYDSEFRLSGRPLQTMYGVSSDRVIYVNTFSKTLAPSMRMGYMVLPPVLYAEYIKLFGNNAGVVPLFEQKALARMINEGALERHINRLKNYYRSVRGILLQKIGSLACPHEVSETGSGLHFTVKFPTAESDSQIKSVAARASINVRCLSDYLLQPREDCSLTAVINYSGVTREQAACLDIKNLV
ncbi:MAG: PLP-dependent aminotransferase family protein [Clostridia bacterium]|nr:PLP-dependent aminotransferase family protein [Clostridia bacterium]